MIVLPYRLFTTNKPDAENYSSECSDVDSEVYYIPKDNKDDFEKNLEINEDYGLTGFSVGEEIELDVESGAFVIYNGEVISKEDYQEFTLNSELPA